MKRVIMDINLGGHMRNVEIRQRTAMLDGAKRIAELRWNWVATSLGKTQTKGLSNGAPE